MDGAEGERKISQAKGPASDKTPKSRGIRGTEEAIPLV